MASTTSGIVVLLARSLRCLRTGLGVTILLSLNATELLAQEKLAYFCEIKMVGTDREDGSMQFITKPNKSWLSFYFDSPFKVIKETGQVEGGIVSNIKPKAAQIIIIDKGGENQSYKLLSIFGPYASVLYLQISDYGQYRAKGEFPFIGIRWQEVISGVCR